MKKIKLNKRRLHLRIIVLIPVFLIILVAHLSFVFKRTWHFILYGGEWVNFEKPERETIAGIYAILKKDQNNEFADILERLVSLKDYKDKYGKDEFYQKEQPVLWNIAKERLKTLTVITVFLLLSATTFSQGRFTEKFQEADSVFTARMELKADSILLCESLKLIDALGSDTVMIKASDAVLLYWKGYTDCIIKYNDTKEFDFHELNNQIKQLSKSIKIFSIQKTKSWKKL